MLIRAMRYIPPSTFRPAEEEKICVQCRAPFVTRAKTKVRCNACQEPHAEQVRTKYAEKVKAKRHAARVASLSARTNAQLLPDYSQALDRATFDRTAQQPGS